jgi:hypothetical protein
VSLRAPHPHRPPGWIRQTCRLAWVAVAAGSAGPAAGQSVPPAGSPPGVTEWRSCRTQTEALAAQLDSLVALEVLAWEQRRGAIASAAHSEELRALARGEALGDTIRAVADALRDREQACGAMGADLLARVEREIAALAPDGEEGARADSLQELRRRLIEARAARRGADLTPPAARPDDGPDVLRVKALRARDLADRAAAWRVDVAALRRTWEDRVRLAQERRELLGDLSFFDAGALAGDRDPRLPDPRVEATMPSDSTAVGRLLQTIMARGGIPVEGHTPAAVFAALDSWLQQREQELWRRAAELDSLAGRWGREP